MIKVLIVEDDPMVAQINQMYVNEIEGYELVSIAHSVDEALKILKRENVDLILLDIFMPEQNGFELLKKIRQTQNNIDVILITAASDIKNIHSALQLGAVDYIIKPFQFERFKNALDRYREQRRVFEQQEKLNQEELDRLLIESDHSSNEITLPKGITKQTLAEVWSYIMNLGDKAFSTEDVVNGVGLSRISIRKYLSFLEDIGAVSSEISYGGVGRPLTLYQSVPGKEDLVESYIQ